MSPTKRIFLLIFGHGCVVLGCFLITWGIYLLPVSQPKLAHILARPLFWGFFSLMGGICANYHGFCRCVQGDWGKGNTPSKERLNRL